MLGMLYMCTSIKQAYDETGICMHAIYDSVNQDVCRIVVLVCARDIWRSLEVCTSGSPEDLTPQS